MKTVLIIQKELPAYRDFLWVGLREKFNLYLADEGSNRLILPDGGQVKFDEYIFEHTLDCMVLNAGIREFLVAIRYINKYRAVSVVGWTQFVGKNRGLLSRLIKSLYLLVFFDRVMVYYDHEKKIIPLGCLASKVVGLNNTISDWDEPSGDSMVHPRSVLFIGRYTEKSKLTLLLEAALALEGIVVNIIGVEVDEVPEKLKRKNYFFHGRVDDLEGIRDIAASCAYFVYPGDVGLSIVHAVKLGLVPVVHSDLWAHMPECRAVAEEIPVVYFQKDDRNSLANTLSLMLELKPNKATKDWIAGRGRKIFSAEVMISNFAKVIEGA